MPGVFESAFKNTSMPVEFNDEGWPTMSSHYDYDFFAITYHLWCADELDIVNVVERICRINLSVINFKYDSCRQH